MKSNFSIPRDGERSSEGGDVEWERKRLQTNTWRREGLRVDVMDCQECDGDNGCSQKGKTHCRQKPLKCPHLLKDAEISVP